MTEKVTSLSPDRGTLAIKQAKLQTSDYVSKIFNRFQEIIKSSKKIK